MATAISLALNTSAKTVTRTGDEIAERETVNVTLTNTSGLSCNSSDLILGVSWKGQLMASIGTSTNLFSSTYTGTINLNTCELVNVMGNRQGNTPKTFKLFLWDTTNNDLLVNDTIDIQNNPYTTGMSSPTAATPIGYLNSTSFTAALRAKLDGIEALADVTDAENVNTAGAVMESDFTNSDSIMVANTSGVPVNLQLGTSTMLGNTSGTVKAMTPAQIRTLINVENGADVTDATNVDSAGALMHTDISSSGLICRTTSGSYTVYTAPTSTVVGRTDTQTLTNKTLTSPKINSTTVITATGAQINFMATTGLEAGDFRKLADITASSSELNIMDGVTAGSSEINVLDGFSGATSDLNILASLTASAAELNILDGCTATYEQLNFTATTGLVSGDFRKLADVTASANEINTLTGFTGATSDLNLLPSITASAAEINVLDGITSNVNELNLLDGITNIVTTIENSDVKLPTAGAVLDYVAATKIDDLVHGDDNTDCDATTTYHGLLPKLSGSSTVYLDGDGNWSTPVGAGDVVAPATNTSWYIPIWSAANSKTLLNGYQVSTDGTLTANSTAKIVVEQAIKTYVDGYYLDNFAGVDDNTDLNTSTSAHGLCPKLSGTSTNFLNGIGTFTTPPSATTAAVGYMPILSGSSGQFVNGNGSWETAFSYSGSPVQGDILYYSGSAWSRLGYGTSGYFLKTNGAAANPSWSAMRYQTSFTNANLSSGVLVVGHGLQKQYLSSVNIYDNNGEKIGPDDIDMTNSSSLTVDLSSYGTLSGTWYVAASL